ncbi:MAG: hypothetical protein MMC33_005612 [Icmadophila ericetorum]|nr:hypothetical protein [Icmadophila ericetorum]
MKETVSSPIIPRRGATNPPSSTNNTRTAHLTSGGKSLSVGDEESFFDFMKDALRVGDLVVGDALKAGALGPLSGPIGALAGFALNAAGRLAESADSESSGLEAPSTGAQQGSMERAVLAEATLTTVQTMDLHPTDEESIFSDMREYIVKAAPTINMVAPTSHCYGLAPQIQQNGLSGAEALEDAATAKPFRYTTVQADQRGDLKTEAFINGVHLSEEGFFDFICTAACMAALIVSSDIKVSLPILASLLSSGAESPEDNNAPAGPANMSSDRLAEPAIADEAALQALMKLPPKRLEEAGFFDWILSAIKTVTPVVMKVAPIVISAIK